MPRLSQPRVPYIADANASDEAKEFFQLVGRNGPVLNIYRALAHHPRLLKRWGSFGTHVLFQNTLPARERELLILRTGWLCRSEYEWGQHVLIARQAGLTDEEIERVKDGPDAPGWTEAEAALLRAADELHDDAFVSDGTWNTLAKGLNTEQLIDLIFTVGQYHTVSMALNTLGVQLDEGVPGFDS